MTEFVDSVSQIASKERFVSLGQKKKILDTNYIK